MGCGASSAVQIAPINTDPIGGTGIETTDPIEDKLQFSSVDNNNSKQTKPGNINGYPPTTKPGFKFSIFQNKFQTISSVNSKQTVITTIVSIGIQTDSDLFGIKTQFTQTDLQLSPEEELDLIMTEPNDVFELFSSDEDLNKITSRSPVEDNTFDVEKSVLIQTEESGLNRKHNLNKKPVQHSSNTGQVTVDVGVQVRLKTYTSATQTRLGLLKTKTKTKTNFVPKVFNKTRIQTNLRKSMSVDICDNFRLWTAPAATKQGHHRNSSQDIETIEIIPISDTINNNILQDFETQTDPKLSTVLAANSAPNDLSLHTYDITSPFAHIERELLQTNNFLKVPDNRLQDCLNRLLDDMDDSYKFKANLVPKCDASVQTDNDIVTDESPEFAARPPPCLKREMIPTVSLFRESDRRVLEAPVFETLQELVEYLCKSSKNDLYKVRAIFRWISYNIKFDFKYIGVNMTSNEIFKCGEGVCKDYCQLFADMCRLAGIRVKKIEGFAKGHDYRPGQIFRPGEDITHTWNAVFISSAWRLIDTTWGTGYTDPAGKFQRKINEHFFLTDPEILIWTHFPYDEMENNYSRWQLLDKPLTLEEFNCLPKVSPNFFDFNLKIRSKPQNPVVFRISTEIKIGSHEAMRYKYKLYPSDELENSSLNHYVFCQLKEDRLVGSFAVSPPIEGRFFLKIFAKPEREMQESQDSTSLQNVCTFLMECTRARKYIEPLPINELPWGPTQTFYDFKLRLLNFTGPVIVTWGGRRRLVMESNETMLISYTIYDADGMEMDTRSIVSREDSGNKITFTISPPRVGTFKLMIFGMPKPKQKGKWRLPLLATFMVDCKLIKPPQYDEDPPPMSFYPAAAPPPEEQTPVQQRRGFGITGRRY